ncbi:Lipid A biosynthesis lauroyltransferase [subsurface metagenome]
MSGVLTTKDKFKLFPLWVITLIPLEILYLLSDMVFIIIYYVVGYRRNVVLDNLRVSFPEKSEKEMKRISRKFYHYLCDSIIESVYLINMNLNECNKRYKFRNPELLENLAKNGRNIILAISHYGNWEWANNLNHWGPYKILGIYKPMSNKLFDRLFIHMRGKYGSIPVAMKNTLREVVKAQKKKELFALYLVADQRPGREDLSYWTHFLNQEAPVITGLEKLSLRYDLPVVFFNMSRVKRGFYEITFELIVENPKKTKKYEITEAYIHRVEKMVKERPEYYLWSHKRWKYKPEEFKSEAAST